MEYQFAYDFRRDYQKPNILLTIGSILLGILFLAGAAFRMIDGDGFFALLGIPALLIGLRFLFFGINGNHPMVKEGQCYLKVSDRKIYSKLGKYAPAREIYIHRIKKVEIADQLITLTLKNGKKALLNVKIIQNDAKRQHFMEFIDQLEHNE